MISDISTQAYATINLAVRSQGNAAEEPLPGPIVACDSTALARAAEEALSGDSLQGAPLSPGKVKWKKIKAGASVRGSRVRGEMEKTRDYKNCVNLL